MQQGTTTTSRESERVDLMEATFSFAGFPFPYPACTFWMKVKVRTTCGEYTTQCILILVADCCCCTSTTLHVIIPSHRPHYKETFTQLQVPTAYHRSIADLAVEEPGPLHGDGAVRALYRTLVDLGSSRICSARYTLTVPTTLRSLVTLTAPATDT